MTILIILRIVALFVALYVSLVGAVIVGEFARHLFGRSKEIARGMVARGSSGAGAVSAFVRRRALGDVVRDYLNATQ